jgi:molybdopterin-guanine dinucleotide biosynthesis protein A
MQHVQQVAGFILAGGESARMGREKAMLKLGGIPIVVRTARLLEPLAGPPSVVGPPERLCGFGLRVVVDDWPGLGPLGGIATALRHADKPWSIILGCDLPYLSGEWLAFLIGRALLSPADALLPQNDGGPEPLCAMYHKRCEPTLVAALARGVRKVTDGLAGLAVAFIPAPEWKAFDSEGRLFKNMNTPSDYEEARARFSK